MILISAFFLCFLLSGCFSKPPPKDKQTIRIAICEEPSTLDPRKAVDSISLDLLRMCHDGLIRKNLQNKCVNSLAEKVELSKDGLTYTFYLREAYWSHGEKITAYDFENTWKTSLSPTFPSPMSNLLYIIKNGKAAKMGEVPIDNIGIKALDESILQVSLEYPASHFLELLTLPIFFPYPDHVAMQDRYISSGPFVMKKWKPHQEFKLKKNNLYWDASSVHLRSIFLPLIQNNQIALNLYENNELDWIGDPLSQLPLDEFEHLKYHEELDLRSTGGIYFYVFNTAKFPYSNKNIRKGLSLAINRKQLTENLSLLNPTPATSLISSVFHNSSHSAFLDGDEQLARYYFNMGLEEVGLTPETFPIVSISYNNFQIHHLIAQSIQQQWQKLLGIHIELKNEEWKTFLHELIGKEFSIARCSGIPLIEDPILLFENFLYESTTNNFSGWSNSKYCYLIKKASNQTDPKKRLQLFKRAEQIMFEEMPIAPIYFKTFVFLKKAQVKNVLITPIGHVDFKWAYMESE